jgi:hypothetical protein
MNFSDPAPPRDEARLTTRVFLAGCRRLAERLRALAPARHAAPGAEPRVWADRLAEEERFLLDLIGGMELEFLTTGEHLDRLSGQLGDIQKHCATLTELTLGRSPDAAVQFAFQLLKKAEDLVRASYEQYDQVFATFNDLQQRLAQLSRQHDELMRVLLPLNFVTLSFRIEASRHPVTVQQAFFTLSESVNRTVTEVRQTMERQFEDIATSERMARSLVEQISTSIQLHRHEIKLTLDNCRHQLHALTESLAQCQTGTTDLDQLNQAVHRHIGTIVLAQQCQDITRQKIEHVGQAMAEMRAHLGETRTEEAASGTARQFVCQAARVQLQQVHSVFDQLNAAADSLKSGIQSLRTESGTAAALMVKVGGTTLDATIAQQCQAGIGEILNMVRQAVQKITDIIAAFKPLQASFIDCTGKATSLACDVRHAGLNAQVFAIHAPEGATLEVLAGRVRVISEEVIQQVEQMRAGLGHTAAMINNLRQHLEDFQLLGRTEEEVLTRESARSRQKLSDLQTAIPALIQRITQQQAAFGQSVEQALANVRFPEVVAGASGRSLGFFQDLVAWSQAEGASTDSTAATLKIDQLQDRYTMASERETHRAAVTSALATDTAPTAAPSPGIELFDDPTPVASAPAEPPGPSAPPAAASEPPPRPETLTTGESTRPPATAAPPAANPELGDNVELF